MFVRKKYAVILSGGAETMILGPFDSREDAVQRGVDIVIDTGIDQFSSREEIADGLRADGRNDVAVGTMLPAMSAIRAGR